MALSIPIISEYDGKGIKKAIAEFKQLETVGEKAQFAIKKAAIPAAAALAGLTTALTLATKAAMEDELEQAKLAQTMMNTVGATEATIKATETMIASMSRASGTADSELRPAFASLLLGTHDVTKATDALALAQNIAIGSNKSLGEVSDALSKAFGGNMKGLKALSPEIMTMIKEGATLDTVMTVLADNFGGATAAAADTAAGKFKILKNSISETKESIGAALLPAVSAVLPYLQRFADWAQRNPQTFLVVAGTIAAVATAIMAINIAMALNPFGLVVIGTATAGLAIYALSQKFEGFGNVVKTIINAVIGYVNGLVSAMYMVYNAIALVINAIPGLDNIPTAKAPQIPSIGGAGAATSGGFGREGGTGSISSSIGSIATPVMPVIASPMSSGGGGGSGGNSAQVVSGGGPYLGPSEIPGFTGGNAERIAITVNGGISTSTEIGKAVYDSLIQYKQVYGPLRGFD